MNSHFKKIYCLIVLLFGAFFLSFISSELYAQIVIPKKDYPSPAEAKKLSKCVSVDFYYGIGIPQDFVKARQCAYLERERGDDYLLGGAALLTMIYANGEGVKRNFDLAIEFAGEFNGAVAETNMMEESLIRLQEENWQGNDFDVCNYQTSGRTAAVCESLRDNIREVGRREKINALVNKWSAKDQQAFKVIQHALKIFIAARAENEIDCSGTLCAYDSLRERSQITDDFIASVESFEQAQFPEFSSEQFRIVDRELNSVYKNITKDYRAGTITFEGIRKTQRAWLQYRDAWVVFGKQRYSSISADAWKTWLTKKRIKMLEEFN